MLETFENKPLFYTLFYEKNEYSEREVYIQQDKRIEDSKDGQNIKEEVTKGTRI